MLIAVLQVMNLKLLLITLYDPASTDRGGALLIGVESSGKSNPYGKGHDISVRFGEFSATGGLKINKLGTEYGGMVVDLRSKRNDLVSSFKKMEEDVNKGLNDG